MSQNGGNMFPAKAEKPEVLYEVKAQRGGFDKPDTLRCKGWKQETILRMLENNMENAEIPEMLVIYGGNGKCARNWESYYAIIESLKNLENDETLVIQSGMPVAVFKTHNLAPRVVMATTNIMKATWERFYDLQDKNLTIFAQYTAAPWEYIGTQGVIEGTFETLSAIVLKKGWDNDMHGKIFLTAGAGGMGGNQTWAGKMHGAVVILADADERVIDRRISKDYMDMKVHSLDEAWKIAQEHVAKDEPISIGVVGNAADIYEEALAKNYLPAVKRRKRQKVENSEIQRNKRRQIHKIHPAVVRRDRIPDLPGYPDGTRKRVHAVFPGNKVDKRIPYHPHRRQRLPERVLHHVSEALALRLHPEIPHSDSHTALGLGLELNTGNNDRLPAAYNGDIGLFRRGVHDDIRQIIRRVNTVLPDLNDPVPLGKPRRLRGRVFRK